MLVKRGLPIAESIQFGWRTMKSHAIFVIGVTMIAWGVPLLIGRVSDMAFEGGAQGFLMFLIEFAVSSTFCLGLAKIYLRFRDGERPIFENLFDGLARLHIYIGAMVVSTIAVVMGLVLLVVPGVIFLIRLWFVGFVVVDEKVGPLDAIQRSWDITRGYTMDLFLLFIVLCGVNLLGAVMLGVGLVVSVPVSGLALASVYRAIKPRAAAPVDVGIAETTAPLA